MKKKLFIISLLIIFLTGCGKYSSSDIMKDLTKKINNSNAYSINGTLQINNNDDTYNYDVKVSYMKDNFYKVSLKNQANDHEQIILKNNEGVYVLTPALNKSFKFQSEWPYNNSQIYLLQSLVKDLEKDENKTFEETDNGYIFITNVNYPNNRKLVKQRVVMDKNLNIETVEVLNENNIVQMKMNFNSIDMKAKFSKNDFDLNGIMETIPNEENNDNKEMSSIDDIIYPLYLPTGTLITSQERVEKTNGERVILTFEGEKPFILVEETADIEEELTVIPTYGEPYLLIDTIGALSDNSITWTSNGIEYYIVSDVMNQVELVEVAQSINVIPTFK